MAFGVASLKHKTAARSQARRFVDHHKWQTVTAFMAIPLRKSSDFLRRIGHDAKYFWRGSSPSPGARPVSYVLQKRVLALELDQPVSKHVLLVLAFRANDAGICWPGAHSIASDTGLSHRSVLRAVVDLERRALICRDRRNRVVTTRYCLTLPASVSAEGGDTQSPPRAEGGDTQSRGGDTQSRGGDSLSPKYTKNKQTELGKRDTTPPASLARAKLAQRGCRLPDDWAPSQEDVVFASALGLDAYAVAAVFCDYWHAKAGKDGVKLDWSGTWRNWCRREAERGGGASPGRMNAPRQTPLGNFLAGEAKRRPSKLDDLKAAFGDDPYSMFSTDDKRDGPIIDGET